MSIRHGMLEGNAMPGRVSGPVFVLIFVWKTNGLPKHMRQVVAGEKWDYIGFMA